MQVQRKRLVKRYKNYNYSTSNAVSDEAAFCTCPPLSKTIRARQGIEGTRPDHLASCFCSPLLAQWRRCGIAAEAPLNPHSGGGGLKSACTQRARWSKERFICEFCRCVEGRRRVMTEIWCRETDSRVSDDPHRKIKSGSMNRAEYSAFTARGSVVYSADHNTRQEVLIQKDLLKSH